MLKRVKWNNHYSLGDLELDFTKPDGTSYNTIILAGENGSGKTTILDTLAMFLNGQDISAFEFIEYEAQGDDYHIVPHKTASESGFHYRTSIFSGLQETVLTGRNIDEDKLYRDKQDIRSYGFAYSKARTGFSTKRIDTVTNQQVDTVQFEADIQEDFTRVKQLLIDIEQQDDSAWRAETRKGKVSQEKYDKFVVEKSKSYRFTNSFNSFFDSLKFDRIENDSTQEKTVLFSKHGKQIPVDQLSTGEKQIVFRGAVLLKNLKKLSGGTVLIDEPELSMHPLWQKKILDYYRGLFRENGIQKSQLIVATHSDYVLQSALEDRDNVLVIALSDDNGKINPRRITTPSILPSITFAEINYLVFNVLLTDYHIELYGYLQAKTGKQKIKECDDYIFHSAFYDPNKHSKLDSYNNTSYFTLPTYIRNAIDHPDSGRKFTEEEFKTSISLLIDLCK